METQMTYGPKIEHLTAYDIDEMPTVTLWRTGEKLPLLSVDCNAWTVTAIKDGHQVVISIYDCDGGQQC